MSNKKFSTALYIRLSKADERKGEAHFSESIENQKILLHDYIDTRQDEFDFYKEYIDDGVSGTDDIQRPKFMDMINDIKAGKVNCVIVKDLSRFARNYLQAGEYLQNTFQKYNTRFIALFDNVDTLHTNGYDVLTVFKNLMNEDYSRRLSNNLISGFRVRCLQGQFLGAFVSYGYKRDPENKNHLIIDEEARAVIEFIFAQFLEGVGKNTIAKKLNDMGVVCPSVYKQQQGANYKNYKKLETTNSWTYSTVQRILQNRVYCGDLVQHKTNHSRFNKTGKTQYSPDEWIIAENCHEPIIDKETFNKVQERLKTTTRDINFTQNISIFAGHLKCDECKRAMAKIQTKYKDKVSTRYVCRSYKSNGEDKKICTSHSINEDALTEFIINKLNEQLGKYKDLEKAINERKDHKVKNHFSEIELRINELKKQKVELENSILGYNDMLASIRFNTAKKRQYDDYQARVDEMYEELEKVEEEIKSGEKKLASDPKLVLNDPAVKSLIKHKRFTELSKEIINAFISTIWVHEDIETNPETNEDKRNLIVKVGFNFEELK